MFFQNVAFILPSFEQFVLKGMLLFSYKIVFIENEAVLMCVTMQERARVFAATISVQQFDIAFVIKTFSFVAHFLNAFQHGNKALPKGSFQNEIVRPLVVFHLPYSKYKGVKTCFYSCRYTTQKISLVLHSCCSCSTRVTLVSHSCRSCSTHVTLVSQSCCTCVALALLVSHSCRVQCVSLVSNKSTSTSEYCALHMGLIT